MGRVRQRRPKSRWGRQLKQGLRLGLARSQAEQTLVISNFFTRCTDCNRSSSGEAYDGNRP